MDCSAGEGKRKKRRGKDTPATINGDNIACQNECRDDYAENFHQERISSLQPGMYKITKNST